MPVSVLLYLLALLKIQFHINTTKFKVAEYVGFTIIDMYDLWLSICKQDSEKNVTIKKLPAIQHAGLGNLAAYKTCTIKNTFGKLKENYGKRKRTNKPF